MKKRKFTYSKMTFILSIIGFIGSVGFYLGVLKQVYSKPNNIEVQISDLSRENKELKTQIIVLTDMIEDCKER
tara:strand:+ start:630 stop:848 length:219 start_codon:yes stop_codon:yes gene_type:complete